MFSLRIGLLAEGGFPFAAGESPGWCDRLVRGLAHHEFDVFAFAVDAAQEASGLVPLPPQVRAVHVAPLWRPVPGERRYGRAERRRFAEHFAELAGALAAGGAGEVPGREAGRESGQDRFASGLYGLAELARDAGGPGRALREEQAVRILERACRAPGVHPAVQGARVAELLTVAAHLDRALRPLGAGWYGDGGAGLAGAALCHALSGGPAALPGLLARRFFGTPLLVTEYGVRLRRHYLESGWGAYAGGTVTVRALVAAFHRRLAAEAYAKAALVTPGNAHARRWALRLGAPGHRLRTVYPGMDAARFAEVADLPAAGDDSTLVWAGRMEPAVDLIALLHAFAEIRREEPAAHLVVAETGPPAAAHAGYRDHCRALAAQLFPDEAADAHAVGASPVSFEEIGDPSLPDRAAAYAAGGVTVLSSVVAGFPVGLVEAMLCGRATVSTDVGAVREVIGGTGLVVPPRNPRALADACLALLRDPARRARLGAAARARAVELFTAEQNVDAFGSLYLELASHGPAPAPARATPHPFAHPPEAYLAATPVPDAGRVGAGAVLEGADR
ncbi:DUF3492 domain-containing protein [Streptomyces sp. NBC_01808]|uniref:DUF3492 domain-containing protein n=1 Tax=Streptomyces sp. NBC_01808 TaxID=2975947 RepID=UPI002DD917C9|nr:DUF3492 domain-containing protein [Streptomyces sp. NBC_01808]WSA40456.1 DUF3492 domain-containing protein [Streptomyces sp. NBC_01808]